MSTLRARAATALACAGVFVLAACAEQTTPGGDPTPPSSPTTDPAPSPPTPLPTLPTDAPTAPPSGKLPPEVDAAVADLAQHLGVPTDDVTVVSFEEVTWPDGALGCPQPGMSYTQALVPGTRLVLEVDDVEYAYHGGRDTHLVRCDSPRPPVPDLPGEDS